MLLGVTTSVGVIEQAEQQITGHAGYHVVVGRAMLFLWWCIEVLIVIVVVELKGGWRADIGGLMIGLWRSSR